MALNVSAWAIRTPIPSIVLFIVPLAVGIVAFSGLPVTHMSNIDLPVVSVSVRQACASPDELEAQVTKRIEAAIASISGVKHIQSTVVDTAPPHRSSLNSAHHALARTSRSQKNTLLSRP
jgi:HAE1 family hydrophobic/amphiphilic exporter-1